MNQTNDLDIKAKIFYFFREKYYNSMLVACKEGIAQYKSDISFHLFHALALMLNNRAEECVNELDAIRSETDVKLASIVGLLYAHKFMRVSNKELFQKLDGEMKDLRKHATAVDFYHAGFVLFVVDKPEKAVDYVEKALSLQSSLYEANTLKGWILLVLKRKGLRSSQNIPEIFDHSLKENKRNLDDNLGSCEAYLNQNKLEHAMDSVNKSIVRFPDSHLPLIEKMKVQFAAQDWEQASETMNRISDHNPDDLDAIKMNVMVLLCKDANYEEAVLCLKRYINVLEKKESKNGHLLIQGAQLFSKICGRDCEILKETFKMAEKAVQIASDNIDFVVELAHQSLISGRVKDASKYYKSTSRLSENSLKTLLGLTICELSEKGPSDQIKKQVEYLLEMEEAQNCAELYLVRAKITANSVEALEFLQKACDLHLISIKSFPYSDSYLIKLDPDFLLEVVKQCLQYVTPTTTGELSGRSKSNTAISTAQNVLRVITKSCPGLNEAQFLLAKLQFFDGDITNSMSTLEQILTKVDDKTSDAYLLMAQVQVDCSLFERASQNLELSLSHNFKVRENPMYHFIRGLVDKNTNNLQDALKSLTTALNLFNTNQTGLTLTERASIYIELIDVHNLMGQTDEAAKLLEGALKEFQNTQEEARILVLSAEHAIKRNNIQGAIDLLHKIKPKESYYLQARTKLADIMLKYRMDKYAYLQCYQEMVEENSSPESYLLLGDAFMNILEPDDALECYNLALRHNPKDPFFLLKMGQALVQTHYFAKAVNFYKDAIKSTQNSELKLHLAELYMQLKEFDKAEMLLVTEIEAESSKNLEDLTYLQYKTKLLILLAQTQEKSGKMSNALSTLKDAKDNQNRVRKRLILEQSSAPIDEINLLVEIGVKLAEISVSLKDRDQAIQFYKETLDIKSNNTNVLVALAKLYMQMNMLDPCQQVCTTILKIEPDNESASVMMADLAFRKIDFDMALFHFTQLIVKQPTNWEALVRLVEITRRTGNLEDIPEYLANAERCCSNPTKDAGLLFCTALYQWFSGNLNGALRNFNGARQDPTWGQTALHNMIEICLNPDDEMLNDHFMDSDDEYRDSRSMALKTADRLLKEYKQKFETNGEDLFKFKLLSNFRLLASQEKHNIERGLEDFIAIASQGAYKDHVGPILGMSTAYTLLKQSQRAKNQLKRVAKTAWTFEDAEYLERCWLMLADYYIQSTKFEVASELLNKVVQHNKTCSKAYEYLGYISEKEQRYRDACNNYEAAWRFGGKTNAGVGYKLAHSLMKCKNYADAIDIGHQVLKLSPGYPKIKKDILDKSMNNLRI